MYFTLQITDLWANFVFLKINGKNWRTILSETANSEIILLQLMVEREDDQTNTVHGSDGVSKNISQQIGSEPDDQAV